jgi:hypothetical protein
LTESSSVSTVSSQKELCSDIIVMGKKVQDLSERVAKLDNGKIHTLSAAEEEVLDECGIQKEMELQCPNIDMISEFADRYVININHLL